MRKIILAGAIGFALAVSGCTADQKNTARAVAASAIDAACNNVPNMDSQWSSIAPRANRSAQLAYNSAKATLVSICNNRPIDKPEKQIAAVSAAVAQIGSLIAAYVLDR